MRRRVLMACLAVTVVAGVGAQPQQSLTVYTGRGKGLVDPILNQFSRDTGIQVQVRYATDAALLAALAEEGSRSPADVFWSNTSGALGVAAGQKMFVQLPASLRGKAAAFAPESGVWTPLSVRFRALAYNTAKINPSELSASVFDLPKLGKLRGRIGWTLGYSSFQDFIGAMIALKGQAATREWLVAMKTLEPKNFGTSNTAMMEAIRAGEIDVALTNHYYIQRFVKAGAPIGTHYFAQGDVGSLALVTGAGILKTSKNMPAAQRLIRYLLEPKAQQFFTSDVFEYPVVSNVIIPSTLLPFEDMLKRSPQLDQERTGAFLEPALKLLRETGLL